MGFMAILKIARLGHPVLLRIAEPVPDPTTAEMRRLVADMVETMEDANGLGLAAPQVYRALRLFVWRVDDGVAAIFNPEITPLEGPAEPYFEGCLSIPGLRGEVTRPSRIAFRGLDMAGQLVEGTAQGLAARVMQHEHDHLNGVLYPMRMTDLSRLGFTEELARNFKVAPVGTPTVPTDISNTVSEVQFPRTIDTGETTAFGSLAKTYVVGLSDATISVTGFFDATVDAQLAALVGFDTAVAFEYGPEGSTTGRIKYTGNCYLTSYQTGAPVGDVVSASAQFQVTGTITRGTY